MQIRLEEDRVVFCIADDGVGMSREEIRELYEKCEMNDTNQNIGLKNVYPVSYTHLTLPTIA